jgi:hypothetical protein
MDTSAVKGDAEKGLAGAGFGKLGEQHGKAFGGAFSGAFKGIVAGLGAVFAAAEVVEFLKDAVAEQREAIRVGNLTNAVLKSTGGVARVTAQQIGDLANAQSVKLGVDDELIQSGENLLLTFTRVHNEAGKGNDIFNQATAAIDDMTAAMNNGEITSEGLKASTIQVGKALNDPIKGMTALSKVGVTFTAQQKEQIENFVKSGNIMGAQKVILAELTTEFGGAGAAASDPAKKAEVAWKNFQEQIGGYVMPILARLGAFFTGVLLPVIQNRVIPFVQMAGAAFVAAFREGDVTSSGFVGVLERLGGILGMVWRQAQAFWTGMTSGAGRGSGELQQLGAIVRDYVVPAISALVGWLSQTIGWLTGGSTWAGLFRSAIAGAAGAILIAVGVIKVITAAQWLWNVAMSANPIGIIIVAIGALVAGVIYAYTHFKAFRDIVDAVWHGIVAVALWAWNNVLKPTIDALVVAYQAVATAALWLWHNVLEPAWQGIAAAAGWLWNVILHPIFEAWRIIIMDVIVPVVTWLARNIVVPLMQAIGIAFQIMWAIAKPIFETMGWILVNVVGPAVMWLWHHVIEPAFQGMGDNIKFVWNNLIKPVFDALGWIINNAVAPAFRTGVEAIKTAWNAVSDVAKVPINFVIGFINAGIIHPYNDIAKVFGVKDRVNDIAKLASGGRFRGIGGPRDDKNLALLSDGEFVTNAAATAKWLPVLEYINSHGHQGSGPRTKYPGDGSSGIAAFADGGLVGWLEGVGKGIWDAITDPAKFIGDLADRLLRGIPGGEQIVHLISGMGHKLIDALVGWVKGSGGGAAGNATAFLKSQVGKPYIWASAGPDGYDCSGIVSAVWNVLHGRNPYQHTFSTSNEFPFFPLPGQGGILTAGWSNLGDPGPGGNSVGHTAAVLAGLPFESIGGSGVRIGGGVTPVGAFAHVGHFDRGGQLAPGWNLAYNGTGRGEPVGGPLELSDATIAKLGRAIGREIAGVGRATVQAARAY